MSTHAFKALLIREIEQAMRQIIADDGYSFQDGQLDAYAHILQLIKDDL